MHHRKVQEYLKRLKRREVFLEKRIEYNKEEKSHYDRAELVALRWAIMYIEDTEDSAADHLTNLMKREI